MVSALYSKFEETALLHSSRTAIVDAEGSITYQEALDEIDELSKTIGHPDKTAVFIVGPKTRYSVLWQQACAKSGQVFVPCDQHTPAQRLSGMIGQIRPRAIIDGTEARFEELGFSFIRDVPGGSLWEKNSYDTYPEAVSHIILSSGSTGTPKAILLPAEPVHHVVRQQAYAAGIFPNTSFAWLLSPSFDASLSDIYATLMSGAALHVCDFSMRNIKTLRKYFNEHSITHTDLSPSILPLLNPNHFPSLRCVIFGGEIANESCILSWHEAGKKMLNAYGPTETTICSHLRTVSSAWRANVIGRPLAGVECLLSCDDEIKLPVAGNSGELLIGGSHLAVGYDSEILNENRFITHRGKRFFRSGDAVRVDENEEFSFIGRLDRQMKIRGTLLCPEEVEALALSFGCREAVLRCDDDRLILDYVPNQEDIFEERLRTHLREHLPSTLVPQRYAMHDSLGRTLSGKTVSK